MTRFQLLPVLLFWLLPFSCLPAAIGEPPALTATVGTGTTAMPAGAIWVFPVAHLFSDDKPLIHVFLIRNAAKKPLTIERVAASCECIQAEIGGSRRLPIKVPPGAAVPVAVRLSSRRLLPGPFSKSVWLYWSGGPRDGLRLELRGTVRDVETVTGAASVSAVY